MGDKLKGALSSSSYVVEAGEICHNVYILYVFSKVTHNPHENMDWIYFFLIFNFE